ncbi:MAG: SRPBCC family protein [Nevskiales bacterium]
MRALLYGSGALGVLGVLLAGLLIWGLAMDSRWRVERSVEIAAAPGPVFAYVSILRNWPEWTAWNPEEYPDMQHEFDGPDWGVGAIQRWHDGDMRGELHVTEFRPGEYLEYELKMDPGKIRLRGSLRIEPTGTGSRLSWSCWGDAGDNPLDKLMMRVYMPMIGRDFSAGLVNLQARFR